MPDIYQFREQPRICLRTEEIDGPMAKDNAPSISCLAVRNTTSCTEELCKGGTVRHDNRCVFLNRLAQQFFEVMISSHTQRTSLTSGGTCQTPCPAFSCAYNCACMWCQACISTHNMICTHISVLHHITRNTPTHRKMSVIFQLAYTTPLALYSICENDSTNL